MPAILYWRKIHQRVSAPLKRTLSSEGRFPVRAKI